MATFVLVHGAWHGSWCWKRVRRALQQQGHEVFTPTLAGVGERSHLLAESVDLQTHTMDVLNLIQWEELTDFVLCGHSYGGMVVSGVADRVPQRIRSLVFSPSYQRTERALCISRPYQRISSLMAGKAGQSVPKYLASVEIRRLIREMSTANPLWGAPRIHGKLLTLAIDIGQARALNLWPAMSSVS